VNEGIVRRTLFLAALAGLMVGLVAWFAGRGDLATWCGAAGTIPVVAVLFVSMVRDLLGGRLGVVAVAFISVVRDLSPLKLPRGKTPTKS
jgi:hypothetical protein